MMAIAIMILSYWITHMIQQETIRIFDCSVYAVRGLKQKKNVRLPTVSNSKKKYNNNMLKTDKFCELFTLILE